MKLEIGPHWGLTGVHGGATRALVMGTRGAVSSAHWLASIEGLRVLQAGGNAFDAAVVAAVVSIAEPYMSGIGGVGGAICYHAETGRCSALDCHGFAPAAASPERWQRQDELVDGVGAALVPGLVAGWAALLERHGTIDLARALEPAIEHARRGVPVSILCARHIAASAERLRGSEGGAAAFLPAGRPLRAGELLVQETLARTLETIAGEGPRAFYEGAVGAAIAEACGDGRGLITRGDHRRVRGALARHGPRPLPWPRRPHAAAALRQLPAARDAAHPRRDRPRGARVRERRAPARRD